VPQTINVPNLLSDVALPLLPPSRVCGHLDHQEPIMIRPPLFVLAALLWPAAALAQSCAGNPNALGTERVLEVDARSTPRVGRKHFPATLPLQRKEVVLTFDDGPLPETTPRVLDALKQECVRATFFLLGRNAEAHPGLALYGQRRDQPATPFFRFPGFASNERLLDLLARRGIVVFGADVWASDWNEMSPPTELRLIMSRLEASGGGIVLFHDTRSQTVAMLPGFLRELKRRGYRIVHAVPAGSRGILR